MFAPLQSLRPFPRPLFVAAASGGDITTDLTGWWKLDEGSGTTAADSSGSGNTGTLTNSPAWATGISGGALSFSGGSEYVDVPDSTSLKPASAITFSAWLYPVSFPSGIARCAISKEVVGSSGYMLYTDASHLFYGFVYGASTPLVADSTTYPLNTWTHIAVTYDGATLAIYRDGALANSVPSTGALAHNTLDLWLGRYHTGSGTFDGLIDEARVYSRALSAADISTLYAYR